MTEATKPAKMLTYLVETCRHKVIGKVKVRVLPGEDSEAMYNFAAKYRAERAMRRRFGRAPTCAFCGEPRHDVHLESFEERYPFPEFATKDCAEKHSRRAPIGLRNPNAAVYRVDNCMGDLRGFVTVLKKLPFREREEQAYKTMCRRFGKPHTCSCDSTSHDLRQVSGPGLWR